MDFQLPLTAAIECCYTILQASIYSSLLPTVNGG